MWALPRWKTSNATADAKQSTDGSASGIDASVAVNVVNDTTSAGMADGSQLTGTHNLGANATAADSMSGDSPWRWSSRRAKSSTRDSSNPERIYLLVGASRIFDCLYRGDWESTLPEAAHLEILCGVSPGRLESCLC